MINARYRLLSALLFSAAFMPGVVVAGHGFMNSFADIEWLPEAGIVAGDWRYVFDNISEEAVLAAASFGNDPAEIRYAIAREKLAEIVATVKTGSTEHVTETMQQYTGRMTSIYETVTESATPQGDDQIYRYALNILEHLYILSIEYTDMPLETRQQVLPPFFEKMMKVYENVRDTLPESTRESLFFKEEEIRWSLEMTTQADEQKIVN